MQQAASVCILYHVWVGSRAPVVANGVCQQTYTHHFNKKPVEGAWVSIGVLRRPCPRIETGSVAKGFWHCSLTLFCPESMRTVGCWASLHPLERSMRSLMHSKRVNHVGASVVLCHLRPRGCRHGSV